ncbi:MAG: hypothetical protein R3B99_23160 [Polyangiales bacterium]
MKRVLVVGAREHGNVASGEGSAERCRRAEAAPGHLPGSAARCSVSPPTMSTAQVALASNGRRPRDRRTKAPLVAGLVDRLAELMASRRSALRETRRASSSKAFSKDFADATQGPDRGPPNLHRRGQAIAYVREAKPGPLVVKADGLAAGKGVVVAQDADEAVAAIGRFGRERELGDAGATLVIEGPLTGQKVSFHVVCDGTRYVALAPARSQAHLRRRPRLTRRHGRLLAPARLGRGRSRDSHPRGGADASRLRRRASAFRGALFVGLMIEDGEPQVLGSVRFGDPETECLMTRWGGSMSELLEGAAKGDLGELATEWDAPASMCVVLASEATPGAIPRGGPSKAS